MSDSLLRFKNCMDSKAIELSLANAPRLPRSGLLRCLSEGSEKSLPLECVPTSACSKIDPVLPGSWTVPSPRRLPLSKNPCGARLPR